MFVTVPPFRGGRAVRQSYRKEKGVKKAHICRKLGKNTYYLRDAEKTNIDINGDSLSLIAEILGTTPEYLSGETDEQTTSNYTPVAGENLPMREYREVLAGEGIRILLDADSKLSRESLDDIIEFIKFKQQRNDRT